VFVSALFKSLIIVKISYHKNKIKLRFVFIST